MKRILTILLVVMMVFSMTGCDPESRANLANLMGSMGQNVLGSDTSAVGDVVANTKVNEEEVKTADEVLNKQSDGSAKVDFGGISVDISKDDAAKIEHVLPPIKDKDKTIENIGSALKNEKAKDELIQEMKKPVESEKVQKAAQGSAIVMKSAVAAAEKTLEEKGVTVPEGVSTALASVKESLATISNDSTNVSNADVVVLQLVNDFVETVNKNIDNMTDPANIPQEVLTDANNLFTVSSALSEASKFNPNTLVGAVVSGIPKGMAPVSRAPRAIEDKLERPVPVEVQKYINIAYEAIEDVLGKDDFAQTKSGLGFHKMSYENYANMVAGKVDLKFVDRDDKNETITPSYDKSSAYLTSREFTEFKSFAGLSQYIVAAAFSEGDDLYLALKEMLNNPDGIDYTVKVEKDGNVTYELKHIDRIDTTDFASNVRDLILEFEAVNPWINKPTDQEVDLVLPEKYKELENFPDMEAFGEVFMRFMTGRNLIGEGDAYNKIDPGKRQYFRAAYETVNRMLVFTDLGELTDAIGDVNLNYGFTVMIEDLYMDKPETKPEAQK